MRFKSLGSGSAGNATLIESAEHNGHITRLLVDCGFSQRELVSRLKLAELGPQDVSAIFITHEHADHIGCAVAFAQRWNIPLWMSEGTAIHAIRTPKEALDLHYAHDGSIFEVGQLRVTPFTVPHDAREPLQVKVEDGIHRMAVLTDLGRPTDHAMRHIYNCQALVLEANHEPKLLLDSNYPYHLKKRIASEFGHLSNQIAADILQEFESSKLKKVVAAHLSEQNNLPELVWEALARCLQAPQTQLCIADALQGTKWQCVG